MGSSIKKIRKILTAIDFSSHSKGTFEYAYEISQSTDAELIAINIISQREINVAKEMMNPKSSNEFSIVNYLPKEIGRRELKFEGLLVGCGFKKSPPIKLIVDYGIPLEKILERIEKESLTLTVFQ